MKKLYRSVIDYNLRIPYDKRQCFISAEDDDEAQLQADDVWESYYYKTRVDPVLNYEVQVILEPGSKIQTYSIVATCDSEAIQQALTKFLVRSKYSVSNSVQIEIASRSEIYWDYDSGEPLPVEMDSPV